MTMDKNKDKNIVDLIKEEVINLCSIYKEESIDKYDFWNEHIKYVYEEAIRLAELYGADYEIVSLGALLHDIALIKKVGDRKDHHINGSKIAEQLLKEYGYATYKIDKVLGCIYNHRSSKNATNIEELCVADADILAHFDNIPMLFNSAFNRSNVNLNEVRSWMKGVFDKDYNDLSEKTKESFKEQYDLICKIVL